MASKSIDIKIGTLFDAYGVNEAKKSLARLAQDVERSNASLRQVTLKAAGEIESYAAKADKACRAMGGGYKDAATFIAEATAQHSRAASAVKGASSAFDDFQSVLKRAAETVDKRNANIKQAAEVTKALESAERKLAAITDTSSAAYAKASRNVEILKQALSSLGVSATKANKPVESVPSVWRGALAKARGHVSSFVSAVGRNLMNIQAGFHMASRAVHLFASALSKGMEYERMTTRFKSLTGSIDLARSHMKDLQDLGRTPPFSLEQFAAASQMMLKMTGGMAGFKNEMKIVGDMAAATGNDIAMVGRAFGLAYQAIRDGQDFGRAGQMLYTMGIMTKKQVADFAELSKAGTDNAAVWKQLMDVFGRYKGAMAETEQTTKGLVEAVQGEATVAITEFSSAISDAAKPALEGLLGYLKRINEDGTIEDWADRTVESLSDVGSALAGAADKIKNFLGLGERNTQGTLMSWLGGIGAGISEGSEYGGGLRGFRKAQLAYLSTHTSNLRSAEAQSKKLSKMMVEDGDAPEGFDFLSSMRDQDKQDAEYRRIVLSERKKKREADASKANAAAEERKAADLAAAQKKKDDERRAANFDEYKESGSTDTFDKWLEDKAKKDAKSLADAKTEYAKYLKDAGIADVADVDIDDGDDAFKKWREKHDKKIEQEIADAKRVADEKLAAEKKAEEEAHKLRLDNINAELNAKLAASKDAATATEAKIGNAQTEFDKAFAMYRSEDKGAAQIAEERDYAEDYKQLQKDATRYGGKWRIDELSSLIAAGDTKGQQEKLEEWRKSSRFTPEVESMVRAAAADQTRTTAEDELRKISNNTENLAKKLDELLQAK